MLIRLARAPLTPEEKAQLENLELLNFQDPTYGEQLQELALQGLSAEGNKQVRYTKKKIQLGDGTIIELRKPDYQIENLAYGALHPTTTISPRVANPMIGLGLVEAIHPADIFALADPQDKNGDGISGKLPIIRNAQTGELALGRFGWKAQNLSIRSQSASAFAGDIGISSPDVPNSYGDCTEKQTACFSYPTGEQEKLGKTEAPDPVLELVTFYSQNLAVPARRDVNNPQVLKGKQLFYQTGCTSCHNPKFVTHKNADDKIHAFQLIWPYSDFLLHDMGEELADNQQVGSANGQEWRTPPLWGIGLTKIVSNHTFFLHDGRARNLTEAILWHGGEGEKAKNNFANLPEKDRRAVIRFLESL